jgi:plastocyanin
MNTIPSTAWRWLPAALAVAAIVLATITLETGDASAGARASGSRAVRIANFAFHPKKLTVRRGSRVTFTNSSGVTHTATDPGSFDTGEIAPGGSAVVRFSHKGVFAYHCTIHPFMHGKIVVK